MGRFQPPHFISDMATYLVSGAALLAIFGWTAAPHSFPWPAFHNDLPFFVSLLLLSHLSLRTCAGNDRQLLQVPRSSISLCAIALIPLIQCAFGRVHFFGDAFMAFVYIAAFALALIVGFRMDRSHGNSAAALLAYVCLVGATVSVFLAALQWLSLDAGWWLSDLPGHGRPSANLAQPNNLGTLLCCGLAAAIYSRESGRISFPTYALLSLLLFSGVAMSRSRTSLLIVIGFLFLHLVYRSRFSLKTKALEALGSTAAAVALWVYWPALSERMLLHSEATASRFQQTMGGDVRLLLWRQLTDAVVREPFFGYGWNQVSLAQVAVAHEYPQTILVEHAHNLFIDLLVWNGAVVGIAIVLACLWWVASRAARAASHESYFGLLIVLALAIHAMLEFPVEYAYFLLPLGFSLGIIEARHPSPRLVRIPRACLQGSLAIGWFLVVWVAWEYGQIHSEAQRVRYAAAGIVVQERSPTPSFTLLTQQWEFLRFARTRPTEGMDSADIESMRKVAHRFAYAPSLFRYALALGLNDRYEEAAVEIQRLERLHPPAFFREALVQWRRLSDHRPQLGRVLIEDRPE